MMTLKIASVACGIILVLGCNFKINGSFTSAEIIVINMVFLVRLVVAAALILVPIII